MFLSAGLVGLVGLAIYNRIAIKRSPLIFYVDRMYGGYNARTIPPFGVWIKKSQRGNRELMDHELLHWHQYQKLGLLNFYIDYFLQFFTLGYDRMPLEIEARFAEGDYCKRHYRDCVRRGISNTVK